MPHYLQAIPLQMADLFLCSDVFYGIYISI